MGIVDVRGKLLTAQWLSQDALYGQGQDVFWNPNSLDALRVRCQLKNSDSGGR